MKYVAILIGAVAALDTGCGASGAPSDCGTSSWDITNSSGGAMFSGNAQCTRYSPGAIGVTLGNGGFLLNLQFPTSGNWLCTNPQVEVTFTVPFASQSSQTNPSYLAGQALTNGPPNGSCSFSVGDAAPTSNTVLGTITASVGRCTTGACDSTNWEYVSISGNYQAYNTNYQGH